MEQSAIEILCRALETKFDKAKDLFERNDYLTEIVTTSIFDLYETDANIYRVLMSINPNLTRRLKLELVFNRIADSTLCTIQARCKLFPSKFTVFDLHLNKSIYVYKMGKVLAMGKTINPEQVTPQLNEFISEIGIILLTYCSCKM